MEDLIKKFLYTSVGLVSATADKVQQKIDELVEQGNISEEEGKKVVDDLVESSETKKEEFESKAKELANDFLAKFKFVTQREMEGIIERLEAIEAKLNIDVPVTEETEAETTETPAAEDNKENGKA